VSSGIRVKGRIARGLSHRVNALLRIAIAVASGLSEFFMLRMAEDE
jgi:hypothetical protein